MLKDPNLTIEKAIALRQSAKQTKIHAKELKQEEEIYRIKSDKMENRYSQPGKKYNSLNTVIELTSEEIALYFIKPALTAIKKDTLPTFVCPLTNP